jgi:hypothetical protein
MVADVIAAALTEARAPSMDDAAAEEEEEEPVPEERRA